MSKQSKATPIQINKYTVVPGDGSTCTSASGSQYIPEATQVFVEDLLSPALGRVHVNDGINIPEANGLTWIDGFFDDNDDIIAVFDFDYDQMSKQCVTFSWLAYLSSLCFCPPLFWIGAVLQVPCNISNNADWHVRSQHLAVSHNGVVFVHDSRKSLWGYPCSDIGKTTITIPFKDIAKVNVNNDGVDLENPTTLPRYLKLNGLKNPEGFRTLVTAMMRKSEGNASNGTTTTHSSGAAYGATSIRRSAVAAIRAGEVMDRTGTGIGTSDPHVTALLSDIRDELRRHNQRLDYQPGEVVAREII